VAIHQFQLVEPVYCRKLGLLWTEFFFSHQTCPETFLDPAVSTNPNCCDTSFILNQSETSGPRGGYWVAFIVVSNLRSFIRYCWLVLGKLDNFTAPVAGYCLHLFRNEISNVKFDHFRHNIVLFTPNMMIDSAFMAFLLNECGHKTARSRSRSRPMDRVRNGVITSQRLNAKQLDDGIGDTLVSLNTIVQ
jgi:hypothetical protein